MGKKRVSDIVKDCTLFHTLENTIQKDREVFMIQDLGLNPWLSIWVRPRQTIRQLIEYKVSHRLILLSFLYGLISMLGNPVYMQKSPSFPLFLLFSIILAIPVGYITFNIGGFLIFVSGKLIKGKGTFKQIRTALCWSYVPFIISGILTPIFWNTVFSANQVEASPSIPQMSTSQLVIGLINCIILIWGLIVRSKALGEVQGFSAWKALLNLILFIITVLILLAILLTPVLLIWGVPNMAQFT